MSGQTGFNTFHGFDQGPPPPGIAPQQPYTYPQYPTWNWPTHQPTYPIPPQNNTYPIYSYSPPPQPILAPPYQTWPPSIQPSMPPLNPLGYTYLFPSKHALIHIFKTKEKPWQYKTPLNALGPNPTIPPSDFIKVMVPITTTLKDLMVNLGCTNPIPAKNKIYEITECGAGRWLKGMEIGGENAKACAKSIKDYGWDETRTGEMGKKPLVWIYVTKD